LTCPHPGLYWIYGNKDDDDDDDEDGLNMLHQRNINAVTWIET
jgi:hypothetical protein